MRVVQVAAEHAAGCITAEELSLKLPIPLNVMVGSLLDLCSGDRRYLDFTGQ